MKTLRELMDLQGRVAMVAGGAGNIGLHAGAALAELGASVAVVDLDAAACEEAAAAHRAVSGVESLAIRCDLACHTEVGDAVSRTVEKMGSLDIVVYSAALVGSSDLEGWIGPFESQGIETWRRAIDVNLGGAFSLIQSAAPALARSQHASVVLFSSIYGMVGPDLRLYEQLPMGNPAAYAASKGGLLAFMRWAATVMAPEVRCNSISPGGVFRNQDPAFVGRYESKTPLGRMASEEDLKGAVAYLASDLSSYVTGHNLVVDGGWTAW